MAFVRNNGNPIWSVPEHNRHMSIPITELKAEILKTMQTYGPDTQLPFPQEVWTIYSVLCTSDLIAEGMKHNFTKPTRKQIKEIGHNIPDTETFENNIQELDGEFWIFIEGKPYMSYMFNCIYCFCVWRQLRFT